VFIYQFKVIIPKLAAHKRELTNFEAISAQQRLLGAVAAPQARALGQRQLQLNGSATYRENIQVYS
jgi:hypothetical protein